MLYNCAELALSLLSYLLLRVICLWGVFVVSRVLKYFAHALSILIPSRKTSHLFSLGGSHSEIQHPDSMTQTPIWGSEIIESALWNFHCYCPQTSKERPPWLSVVMAHILGIDAAEQVVIIKLFLTAPLQYGFLRVSALSF